MNLTGDGSPRERLVEIAACDPYAASRRLAEVALDMFGSAPPAADAL